jgi:hypothetical protein
MKTKMLATLSLAGILTVGSAFPVFAAQVTETEGATASQAVSVVKENVQPTFSVDIPAAVNISSADATKIEYSINEEDLNNIPEGKKVAITIADAGYDAVNGKFALYNEATGEEATYGLYGSIYSTTSDPYVIGGKGYVSFYGTEKVTDGKFTMSRAIKVNNYDSLQGGTYTGYIQYNIAVIDQ